MVPAELAVEAAVELPAAELASAGPVPAGKESPVVAAQTSGLGMDFPNQNPKVVHAQVTAAIHKRIGQVVLVAARQQSDGIAGSAHPASGS